MCNKVQKGKSTFKTTKKILLKNPAARAARIGIFKKRLITPQIRGSSTPERGGLLYDGWYYEFCRMTFIFHPEPFLNIGTVFKICRFDPFVGNIFSYYECNPYQIDTSEKVFIWEILIWDPEHRKLDFEVGIAWILTNKIWIINGETNHCITFFK